MSCVTMLCYKMPHHIISFDALVRVQSVVASQLQKGTRQEKQIAGWSYFTSEGMNFGYLLENA